MKKTLLLFALLSFGAFSCSKSSSSDTSNSGSYSLKVRVVSTGSSSISFTGARNLSTRSVDDSTFLNTSIGSGTPEELTFKIKRMYLKSSTDSSINLPIYINTNDDEITVRNSSVDLSNFFTKFQCVDANGNSVSTTDGSECPCGINADGSVIAKVSTLLPDGSTGLACPELTAGQVPPLGVMTVTQSGTYDTLSVEYYNAGKMKGCVT